MTDPRDVSESANQSSATRSGAARRKEQIATDSAPHVGGSYSQGIRAGDFIFLSGQTPRNRERAIVDGSFEDQVRRTLENLAAVAAAGGASLADAVKVNVYLQRWSDFDDMDRIYREFFAEPRPARTTVQSDIPVSVEVDATLWIGDRKGVER